MKTGKSYKGRRLCSRGINKDVASMAQESMKKGREREKREIETRRDTERHIHRDRDRQIQRDRD